MSTGGGKPPRVPVPAGGAANSSSNSSSPITQKSPTSVTTTVVGRSAELEALKQRGLAKILNKHFTETANRLAQEKAAADAAVADLRHRKAHTSEFHVSGDGPLSPLDAMCLQANQWKRECQRKERETLLLYQRYVHKFGDSIVQPGGASTLSPEKHHWVPPATPDTARTAAPLPPRPSPAVAVQGTQVPELAAQIETTLEEYLQRGALSQPSVLSLGKDATFHTLQQREEAEFRAFYRRQMESRGVDARACPQTGVPNHEPYDYTRKRQFGIANAAAENSSSNNGEVDPFRRNVSGDWIDSAVASVEANLPPCQTIYEDAAAACDDDDQVSVVSGLTTLHSAMTREVLQDCEQSVADFLREEQAHIRRIMEADESSSASYDYEDDDDDAGTLQVVDLANKATAEAESMVQKMEEILHEYQAKHGSATTKDASSSANKGDDQAQNNHEPRPFPTDNPDEHWMVYYDEFYRQEYYHETNSNRTQWEPPAASVGGGSTSASSASVLSHTDVMPEQRGAAMSQNNPNAMGGTMESRIAVYRRKRRRARRRRRIMAVAAVGVAAVAALVGWNYYVLLPPEQRSSLAGQLRQSLHPQRWWRRWTGGTEKSKEMEEKQKLLEEEERQRKQQFVSLMTKDAADAKRCHQAEEEERLRAAAEEEEQQQRHQKALLHRPWGCNIPFSWLFHSRCRRLANQNPVFDLQSLVTVMLQ